jgi:hypothetical protein
MPNSLKLSSFHVENRNGGLHDFPNQLAVTRGILDGGGLHLCCRHSAKRCALGQFDCTTMMALQPIHPE